MYINEPIKKYIEDLAARQPMPGGGSAASLAGALGAALLEMACNFTIGNKRYKDIEGLVIAHLSSLRKIRDGFMALIDEDVKVYGSICSAFKTKDEKIIDKALKDGYYISLKICELSKSGMDIALDLAAKSNINLITDVGCGAELLKACLNSGTFNSEINLKGIKDASFTEKEMSALHKMKNDAVALYEKAISKTNERMA
jgi:formiminotetrahydrofolate cyclodeaminase